ncbi:MAG: TIGR04255 family protein [Promethearchaeota archaeon]
MIDENLKGIKNPPLKSISCEIRFPTFLKIADKIPDFQDKIREVFPKYYTQTLPTTSKHGIVDEFSWNFRSDKQEIGLRVKNNLIVLIADEYMRFSIISKYIEEYFGEFFKINNIDKFSRIGLRYINREDFNEKEPDIQKVLRYFNLFFTNIDENTKINNFNIQFNKKEEKYNINIINKYGKRQDDRYSFVFDYDCYYINSSTIENYLEILNRLHDTILKHFKENIKKEYLDFIMNRE